MESPLLAKFATQQQHSSKQDVQAKKRDFCHLASAQTNKNIYIFSGPIHKFSGNIRRFLWRALFSQSLPPSSRQQHSSKQDARAKRSDFRTEQQAFIALRILYGYSYGLNFVAQSPPRQSPAQSRSSSRKIRVLSDRMNVDKLSLRIQILSEDAFLVSCTCVFTKKRSLSFLDSIDSGGLWEKLQRGPFEIVKK